MFNFRPVIRIIFLGFLIFLIKPSTVIASNDETAPCGDFEFEPCPLQSWMRANLSKPLAANELPGLINGFSKVTSLIPDPNWISWKEFSFQGLQAAEQGNIGKVREACRGCHQYWKKEYRAKYKNRPLPP